MKSRNRSPTNKLLLREWLIDHLEREDIYGLEWIGDKHEMTFKVCWVNSKNHQWNGKTHGQIFKEWFMYKNEGYKEKDDYPKWKTNLRSALTKANDIKSLDTEETPTCGYRTYKFLSKEEADKEVQVKKEEQAKRQKRKNDSGKLSTVKHAPTVHTRPNKAKVEEPKPGAENIPNILQQYVEPGASIDSNLSSTSLRPPTKCSRTQVPSNSDYTDAKSADKETPEDIARKLVSGFDTLVKEVEADNALYNTQGISGLGNTATLFYTEADTITTTNAVYPTIATECYQTSPTGTEYTTYDGATYAISPDTTTAHDYHGTPVFLQQYSPQSDTSPASQYISQQYSPQTNASYSQSSTQQFSPYVNSPSTVEQCSPQSATLDTDSLSPASSQQSPHAAAIDDLLDKVTSSPSPTQQCSPQTLLVDQANQMNPSPYAIPTSSHVYPTPESVMEDLLKVAASSVQQCSAHATSSAGQAGTSTSSYSNVCTINTSVFPNNVQPSTSSVAFPFQPPLAAPNTLSKPGSSSLDDINPTIDLHSPTSIPHRNITDIMSTLSVSDCSSYDMYLNPSGQTENGFVLDIFMKGKLVLNKTILDGQCRIFSEDNRAAAENLNLIPSDEIDNTYGPNCTPVQLPTEEALKKVGGSFVDKEQEVFKQIHDSFDRGLYVKCKNGDLCITRYSKTSVWCMSEIQELQKLERKKVNKVFAVNDSIAKKFDQGTFLTLGQPANYSEWEQLLVCVKITPHRVGLPVSKQESGQIDSNVYISNEISDDITNNTVKEYKECIEEIEKLQSE